jgi:lipoprotein-anchoring transpeptidase ErfK/SrfK
MSCLPPVSRRAVLTQTVGIMVGLVAVAANPLSASAKAGAGAKPLTVNPGTPFVGWDKLGENDWPAIGGALIIRPSGSTLNVQRESRSGSTAVAFSSGKSVAGELGLLAVGETADYWKVLVPVRPNGTTGWVKKSASLARPTTKRIVIDLSTNTLQYSSDGKVVLTETVATGTSGTPTPMGLFFVKSIVAQANPNAGLGPWNLVTSGYSTALNSFAGGVGAVGIHGTSAPGKLGQNVSHGCIRVRNDAITSLAAAVESGVPIEVVAKMSDTERIRWTPAPAKSGPDSPPDTNGSRGVGAGSPPVTALP